MTRRSAPLLSPPQRAAALLVALLVVVLLVDGKLVPVVRVIPVVVAAVIVVAMLGLLGLAGLAAWNLRGPVTCRAARSAHPDQEAVIHALRELAVRGPRGETMLPPRIAIAASARSIERLVAGHGEAMLMTIVMRHYSELVYRTNARLVPDVAPSIRLVIDDDVPVNAFHVYADDALTPPRSR